MSSIEPGSVIVLDNAPYHSRYAEKAPNMSWRKADIQAWLHQKHIVYDEKEIKAELLTKFKKEDFKTKVVDEMAAEKNVIVLRLPPYHCELNPIELIWAQIKSHVGRNNKTFKMAEIKELTREAIAKIDAASWTKCIEHVIKEENKMMELDGIIDKATDAPTPFIIQVTSDSESDAVESSDSADTDSDAV